MNENTTVIVEYKTEKALKELKRKIELTRKNRIHAAERLLRHEQFVQDINIYYSCVSAIVTILGLLYPEMSFSIASAIMTVILAISIVYLNAQKYGSRAQQMQMNYLGLQQLGFETDRAINGEYESNKLAELQERYVELLQTSENHISQDHRQTLYACDRQDEYYRWKEKAKDSPRKEERDNKPEDDVEADKENQKAAKGDDFSNFVDTPWKDLLSVIGCNKARRLRGLEWWHFWFVKCRNLVLKIFLWVLPIGYFGFVVLFECGWWGKLQVMLVR